ncbi:hypothetical protein [Ferroacidibacillus organovorans]|uniref:Uncharacterized protein n=1 Tax=Ferroacidibacillus organovorans TaxID=1765683 RepID=A0A101XTY4_9BACL|nr:hypothetical protein [Ferroacidibacillus organovorans]KUO97406.1 hypothetical protein ATW55_05955 [Ferroacidibacillus organovorans]
MHSLLHLGLGAILILACGAATARFVSFSTPAEPFAWNLSLLKRRAFWIGVAVGLMFLYSDYKFDRAFVHPIA